MVHFVHFGWFWVFEVQCLYCECYRCKLLKTIEINFHIYIAIQRRTTLSFTVFHLSTTECKICPSSVGVVWLFQLPFFGILIFNINEIAVSLCSVQMQNVHMLILPLRTNKAEYYSSPLLCCWSVDMKQTKFKYSRGSV